MKTLTEVNHLDKSDSTLEQSDFMKTLTKENHLDKRDKAKELIKANRLRIKVKEVLQNKYCSE